MAGVASHRTEDLKRLRRRIAESWPETPSKELVLKILDEMVWEAHQHQVQAE